MVVFRRSMMHFVWLLLMAPLAAAQAPPTEARPVTETIHGIKLTDPYRWLEDQDSAETRRWIDAQTSCTRAALDAQPGRAALAERLTALMRVDYLGSPARRGNRYFLSRRLAGQDQFVICLREGKNGEIQPLIDPHPLSPDHNISVSLMDISDDGKLLVYGKRKGGEDEVEVHLFDVDRRAEFPCTLPRGRYNNVSLTGDKTGLYFSRREGQEAGRVFYAPLAGPDGQAPRETCIFGKGYDPKQYVSGGLSEDHRYLQLEVSWGWGKRTDIFIRDLKGGDEIRPVIQGIDASFGGETIGDTLYVQTNWKAPNNRILAIDLKDPAPEKWVELVPERKDTVIESFTLAGGRLFLLTSRNVLSRVEIYRLANGKAAPAGEIAFPDVGSVSGVGGRWTDDEVYFSFTSFHIPSTTYCYSIPTGERSVYWRSSVPFDSAPYETRQVWFASKDGTRVPMFIAARKGLKLDGSHPVLLSGYGGFNISRTPAFSSMTAAWLERGGVYAVPNLRGGGEFGEDWHRAGMLDKKQNVFDDFIAAAEYLVREGYCTPERLAISGGSNGGLLMGAALTQRPDLFRAVVCSVPLLDMIRYHKFLLGPLWVPEYGSAEDPAQFKTLLAYSPYQHVKKGTRYPAVLFVTGDSDTRVAPLHARKMTAQLQSVVTDPRRPVLLRYETRAGHSAGQSLVKTIEADVDSLGFLMWQLGMNKPESAPKNTTPAPLFQDPVYNGAADPVVVWNRQEKSWWMFYTNRRANQSGLAEVSWVHGTDIGIASSNDGGRTWLYRGTAQGLNYKPGRNTYWAPDVVFDGARYHMFVVFILGVPRTWAPYDRQILHYTSQNLMDWEFAGEVPLSSNKVIDAGLQRLPDGSWRMWYKDEADKSHIWAADSPDLNTWKVKGPAVTNYGQEGPFVFKWHGRTWMITDSWRGLSVYQSADCEKWTLQRSRLLERPGVRPMDGAKGSHACVMVQGEDAYIIYFVHYINGGHESCIQIAKLEEKDGVLSCDRDAPFALDLQPDKTYTSRGGDAAD